MATLSLLAICMKGQFRCRCDPADKFIALKDLFPNGTAFESYPRPLGVGFRATFRSYLDVLLMFYAGAWAFDTVKIAFSLMS